MSPQSRLLQALALSAQVALLASTSCSSNSATPAATTTAPIPGVPTVTAPSGQNIPPPTTTAASPAASAALDHIGGNLTLDPLQQACLKTALDNDQPLLASLGDNPPASPRWQEVQRLANDCVTKTTVATQFAANVAATIPGITTEQTTCLRDTFAQRFNSADIAKFTQAGLHPNDPNPDLEDQLNDWVRSCGLTPPPPLTRPSASTR